MAPSRTTTIAPIDSSSARSTAPRFVATRSLSSAAASAPVPTVAALPRSTARIPSTAQDAPSHDDFGPLAPYLTDPCVTDVFVNGPDHLWVDRGEGQQRATDWACPGEDALRALAVRLVALGGRHIDEATPCVDVRLSGGMRLHAVLAPISPQGTLISIRVPSRHPFSLDDLDRSGFFLMTDSGATAGADERAGGAGFGRGARAKAREAPRSIRGRIERAVIERSNLLITGAGGSGKTTLLSALISAASPAERIVAIEDVSELRVTHPHFVSLEARQPNLEGAGAITLDRLLREALRMRPDRLVLGECRGSEVRELFSALNTGHDGGAGTLHANSLADVPARLEALGALAGLSSEAAARQAVSAIQLIVHLERLGGRRRVAGVGRLALSAEGRIAVTADTDEPARWPTAVDARPPESTRLGVVGRSEHADARH